MPKHSIYLSADQEALVSQLMEKYDVTKFSQLIQKLLKDASKDQRSRLNLNKFKIKEK